MVSLDVNASLGQCLCDRVIASLLINGNFVVPKYAVCMSRLGHFQYLLGCIVEAAAQNDFRLDASLGQLFTDGVETSQDKGDFSGGNSMNLPLFRRQ